MGRLYGKSGLLIEQWSNDLKQPGTQAILILVFSTRALMSFGQSFLVSDAMQKMTRDFLREAVRHLGQEDPAQPEIGVRIEQAGPGDLPGGVEELADGGRLGVPGSPGGPHDLGRDLGHLRP